MKIKIMRVYGSYYDESQIFNDVTDWEEGTKEQLEQLKDWAQTKNDLNKYSNDWKYVVLAESDISVTQALSEFMQIVTKEQEEQKERVRKKEETTAKRKETMRLKREEKERIRLKELQEKYGDKNNRSGIISHKEN